MTSRFSQVTEQQSAGGFAENGVSSKFKVSPSGRIELRQNPTFPERGIGIIESGALAMWYLISKVR